MTGELTAAGIVLDLTDGLSFPFNYSIADMKAPEKRKRNYSRSVNLPGTQNNMDFFFSAYSLSLSTVNGTSSVGFNFDPTIRIPATYKSKGLTTFIGLLQLNQVKEENGYFTFECTLFSNFIELYLALGDLKVSELGWSEYNHALTRTNVKNSWATSVILNGVATSNMSGGSPLGFGYHYGLVDYGYQRQAPKTFHISDLAPMVYKREVLMKCLSLSNVTVASDFIDSVRFRKQLLGFGGGDKMTISPQEVTNRRTNFTGSFSAALERTSNPFLSNDGNYYASFSTSRVINAIDSDTGFTPSVISDAYQQYEPSLGSVTIERTGNYKISIQQTINISVNTGTMTYAQGSIEVVVLMRRNGSTWTVGSAILQAGTSSSIVVNNTKELYMNTGDVVDYVISISGIVRYKLAAGVDSLEPLIIQLTDSPDLVFDMTSQQASLIDNDIVEISRFIPEMKAADFMAGVFTEFNLYASDPDLDGVVTIEPLTEFYSTTNVFDDWTKLVDHSKPKITIPSSSIDGKFYKFKWAEDNDYDNKRYRDRFGIGYGDYTYEVESTWQKGDRVYQLPFAQTIPTDELTPLIVPRIISIDEANQTKKPFKGKPRVYIWNGLKPGGWRLTDVNGVGYEDLTTYPSVHHFDNWQAPTFDLNWGLPQELQYVTGVITNSNLFNNYHRTFIKEITGRDSKILQVYMKLDSHIINKLDFGRLKMINGVLFRLNEIKDFDDNVDESTLVELVKITAANKPRTFLSLNIKKPAKTDPPIIRNPSWPAMSGVSPVLPCVIKGGVPGRSTQQATIIRG